MDIGFVQSVVTVFFFVVFIGIVLWAWSGRRKKAFEEAARLPLDEDKAPGQGAPQHVEEKRNA